MCFLLLAMVSVSEALVAACKTGNLRCEYLVSPIGIDASHPRLSWLMIDGKKDAGQSAFQVIVGTDSVKVSDGIGDKWTTGKIKSDQMLITYNGSLLEPFTRYFWSVRVWDEKGDPSLNSLPASFETGMMEVRNWKGTWITDNRDIQLKPAPIFRKEFIVTKQIRSARGIYCCSRLIRIVNQRKKGW